MLTKAGKGSYIKTSWRKESDGTWSYVGKNNEPTDKELSQKPLLEYFIDNDLIKSFSDRSDFDARTWAYMATVRASELRGAYDQLIAESEL